MYCQTICNMKLYRYVQIWPAYLQKGILRFLHETVEDIHDCCMGKIYLDIFHHKDVRFQKIVHLQSRAVLLRRDVQVVKNHFVFHKYSSFSPPHIPLPYDMNSRILFHIVTIVKTDFTTGIDIICYYHRLLRISSAIDATALPINVISSFSLRVACTTESNRILLW